ncbi:putative SP-containing membrane protein [Vairimorpha necatrix]|uniref:SP-containing membrane protein n=1 Tax=Vairimorpha necatrix TaxID=6039 RepID=A0AAX4JGC7_9MICR
MYFAISIIILFAFIEKMFDTSIPETTISELLDNMNLIGGKELRMTVKDNNLEVTAKYVDETVRKLKSKTSVKPTIKLTTAVKDWTYNSLGNPWSVIITVCKKLKRHIDLISFILPSIIGLLLQIIDKMTIKNGENYKKVTNSNSHLKIRN